MEVISCRCEHGQCTSHFIGVSHTYTWPLAPLPFPVTANRPDPEGPKGEQEPLLSWQICTTSSSTAIYRIAATCYRRGGGGREKERRKRKIITEESSCLGVSAEQQTTTTSSVTTTSTKELNVQYGGRDTQTDQGH